MDSLTLDQLGVFLAIVEEGSFAQAARRLGRAQSAVTYTIQRLEAHSGVALFDRSRYRPRLTEAGQVLLPRVLRIFEAVGAYRLAAQGIEQGLEAALSIAVDRFVPMEMLSKGLRYFHEAFSSVRLRIDSVWREGVVRSVLDGEAALGVLVVEGGLPAALEACEFGVVEQVAVAAPWHRLAQFRSQIDREALRDHLQIVVTQTGALPDHEMISVDQWHVGAFQTEQALLLRGIGWGSMPLAMVEGDIASGRLARLDVRADCLKRLPVAVVWRREAVLGPASVWIRGKWTEGSK